MLKLFLNSYGQFYKHVRNVGVIHKRLAGHSKWQNIRHIKGAKDAERSAMYTKLGRMIKVAAKEGGSPDPSKNLKLQQVVDQCRRINMPSGTLQNLLKHAQADKSKCKSHIIEINGPGSCIILCEVYTDNISNLKQVITSVLKKHRSKISDGARHMFEEKGIIEAECPAELKGMAPEAVLDTATEHAIESGAEDVRVTEDNYLQFFCDAYSLGKVQTGLEKFSYKIDSASVEYIPLRLNELSEGDLEECAKMYQKLERMDEVVRIADNIA